MSRKLGARLVLTALAFCVSVTATSMAWFDDKGPEQGSQPRLTRKEARELKSPVPYGKESISRGKVLYTRDCTECHGADGKSLVDVVANATDLTDPKAWTSGTSEGEIFRSIRDGAGEAMPPFAEKVSKEEDIWHMVNFLRSLWPESARPKSDESTAPPSPLHPTSPTKGGNHHAKRPERQ